MELKKVIKSSLIMSALLISANINAATPIPENTSPAPYVLELQKFRACVLADNGTIHIINKKTNHILVMAHKQINPMSLAFNADETLMAACYCDGTIMLFNTQTNDIKSLCVCLDHMSIFISENKSNHTWCHMHTPAAACFSKNSKFLALGFLDKSVGILNLENLTLTTIGDTNYYITSISFNHNESVVVVAMENSETAFLPIPQATQVNI